MTVYEYDSSEQQLPLRIATLLLIALVVRDNHHGRMSDVGGGGGGGGRPSVNVDLRFGFVWILQPEITRVCS